MPDQAAAGALSEATRTVLETMFFSEVISEADGTLPVPDAAIEARVHFDGERPGDFRLAVARPAARTIAADFLGLESPSDISEEQINEVTGELANMVCGSVLSQLESDLSFELTHPSIVTNPFEAPPWDDEAARTFDLGNGWVTAAIRFD